MRTLFIILSVFIFAINGNAQFKLPEPLTTQEKAIDDLLAGVSNERWFIKENTDGYASYCKLFKITPIGIKHAMQEFEKVKKEMNINSCKSNNTISPSVIISKEIDYDLLALSIKAESSELNEQCTVNDRAVKMLSLYTVFQSTPSLLLSISTRVKIVKD